MNLTDDEVRETVLENLVAGCDEWITRANVQRYIESVAGRYMGQASARADLEIIARYAFGAGAAWGAEQVASAAR